MREHAVVELEEVCGLGIRVLLGLVDFAPNAVHVIVEEPLDHLEVVVLFIKITQNEKKTLRRRLVEQLQVHFEDHLHKSVVAGSVPSNVLFIMNQLEIGLQWSKC